MYGAASVKWSKILFLIKSSPTSKSESLKSRAFPTVQYLTKNKEKAIFLTSLRNMKKNMHLKQNIN